MMTFGIRDIIVEAFASDADRVQYVHGGSINQAAKVVVRGAPYFIKWKNEAAPGFFEAEADGLRLLREANILRVPMVLKVAEQDGERPAYLILEWLEEAPTVETLSFSVTFGRAIAALHRVSAPTFGLERNNFIGALPQVNTPAADWSTFYRERRLAPQVALAQERRRLTPERERLLRKVMDGLERLLDGANATP